MIGCTAGLLVATLAAGSAGPATLEDIHGPTGKRFQAALGFLNFESTDTGMNPANRGYGMAVDDMVVEWREIAQVPDATDCAVSGSCATVDLATTNVFGGSAVLEVRVLDRTPYGSPAPGPFVDCLASPANPVCVNDCNGDGDIVDAGIDDADCNDNGVPDVVVRATSLAEPAGERIVLDRTSQPQVYRGELPVSATSDATGVLFVAKSGGDEPLVTVTYLDHEDGTGDICRNAVDPAAQGRVQAATLVFVRTGQIALVNAQLTEVGTLGVHHDADGVADAGETVDMRLTLRNTSDTPLSGVIARLATNDPKIDCILDTFISVGALPARTNVLTTDAFRFKVADAAQRSSLAQAFSASFNVTLAADGFDALSLPTPLSLELDLDFAGGAGPTTFVEGFESGTLGAFEAENLDQGRYSLTDSDGYRCQYSDPDWVNSNSYGVVTDCFLGATAAQADAFFWHVDGVATPAGGRGYSGTQALHYGVDLTSALGFTTPTATLEAVRTTAPINLAPSGAVELSLKHQTSLIDDRAVNSRPRRSADRALAMLQLTDAAGNPAGDWITLTPYLNTYDAQAEDNYTGCLFDPVDDGSDEEDFFDPADPDRRLGPSSTCFPAFNWVWQGSTQGPYCAAAECLGRASEGPGLAGATGEGTWIESRVDLSRFRGRRVRLRFLATAKKTGTALTYESLFGINQAGPNPNDDGMWIDDVRVTGTLTTPATASVDTDTITPLPCGVACNSVTPALTAVPASLTAPGQVVELDASGSLADRCLNGTLLYRFCVSADDDCSDAEDTILRGFGDDSSVVAAPSATTHYAVDVRCSSSASCVGSAGRTVAVACPGGALGSIRMCGSTTEGGCPGNRTGILRANSIAVDWLRASFPAAANGPFSYNLPSVVYRPNATANPLDNSPDGNPVGSCSSLGCAANAGFYYLAKKDGPLTEAGFCNSTSWSAGDGSGVARDATFTANP